MNRDQAPIKHRQKEVVGLMPAGGRATRIAPLPCSKELYPIGLRPVDGGPGKHPKVVCHYLLEKMRLAGISKTYIVLRKGKWDIPAYLGDGALLDMHLAYLMTGLPFGVPYTLDQAHPFVRDAVVAFGFADILFQAEDAFSQLLAHQQISQSDVILGLFPVDDPHKVDMVDLDRQGRVQQIIIRPSHSSLRYTWGIAVWTTAFTQFMHDYLANRKGPARDEPELFMGHVFQAAVHEGLRVEAVQVSDHAYLDMGTPEDLARAVVRFAVE